MADMTVAIEMGAGDDIGKQVADLSTAMNKVSQQFGGVGGRGSISGVFESLEELNRELDRVKQQAKQGNIAMGPAQVTQTASGGYKLQADLRARQPNEKLVAGMNELRDGLTSMAPGGSIINAFEKSGMFVGIAVGIVALGAAMKSIVQSSQVWGAMIGTVMKTLSVAVDVMLAPFMPFVAKIAVWIIQHVMPKMQGMGEWFADQGVGGIGMAVGAGIVGYLGLKAGASILGNMGSSLGASLVSKLLAGKVGQSIGGSAATSLSAGVITKSIGKNIGTAITGAIKMSATAVSDFAGKIGTGISGAIKGLPGGNLIAAAFPYLALAGVGAAIGFAVWKRYKQVQAEDDLLAGKSKLGQLRFVESLGVDTSVAKQFLDQKHELGAGIDMVETFTLFRGMTETMKEFGTGYSGLDLEFKTEFEALGPKWMKFFNTVFLPRAGMETDMMLDVQKTMQGHIARFTNANVQRDLEKGTTMAVIQNRTIRDEEGYMIDSARQFDQRAVGEAMLKQYGITYQQANLMQFGTLAGSDLTDQRESIMGMVANTEGGWAGIQAGGQSGNLVSSLGGDGMVTIFMREGASLPDEVLRWLSDMAKTDAVRLGPELENKVGNLANST